MKKLLIILLILYSAVHAFGQQNEDLIRLARLHGLALFVMEDKQWEDRILGEIYQSARSNSQTDLNQLVAEMLPKIPKDGYVLIDTSEVLLVSEPYQLIDDPIWTEDNRKRLENALLGKSGPLKLNYKELDVVEYEDSPTMDELDSMHVIRSFMRIWSSIQYKYPYKQKLETDWDTTFYESVGKFTADSLIDGKKFNIAMYHLSARINDAHVAYLPSIVESKREHKKHEKAKLQKQAVQESADDKAKKTWMLYPINFKATPSGLFIEKLYPCLQTENLSIGDLVESINDWNLEDMQAESKRFYPSSSLHRLNLEFNRSNRWRSFARSDTMRLKIKGMADEVLVPKAEIDLEGYTTYLAKEGIKPPEEQSDFVYLNINESDKKVFKKALKRSAKEELPLVFDARDYPDKTFMVQVPKYLSKKPLPTASFYVECKRYPGIYGSYGPVSFYFTNTFDFIMKSMRVYPTNWNLFRTLVKTIDAPIVVLIDAGTMSWGESTVMAMDAHGGDNLTIIGRNTAGANGNVGVVEVAGQKDITYTRLILNDAEGNNYQQKGIAPDIYVNQLPPDPNDPNRDQILMTAIEYLRERQAVMR